MSSGTSTGTDISADEAKLLLHKLIAESTKVQVAFSSSVGVVATIAGVVNFSSDGTFCVMDRQEVMTPVIKFDPAAASSRKYGPPGGKVPGGPLLSSALIFLFPDSSEIALFEIAK